MLGWLSGCFYVVAREVKRAHLRIQYIIPLQLKCLCLWDISAHLSSTINIPSDEISILISFPRHQEWAMSNTVFLLGGFNINMFQIRNSTLAARVTLSLIETNLTCAISKPSTVRCKFLFLAQMIAVFCISLKGWFWNLLMTFINTVLKRAQTPNAENINLAAKFQQRRLNL